MVLDMAKPKNKKSTIWPVMRGRDAARKSTSKVNILRAFTIDFSKIQFIVNHNSQSDGQNKSAKSGMKLHKKTIHTVSLQRKEKIPRTMVSHHEQVRQKWAYVTSIWFSSRCLYVKSCTQQVEELIRPDQYRRWHPSSSTSWWEKSEWSWKWAHKTFTLIFFLLQLVSVTVDCDPL